MEDHIESNICFFDYSFMPSLEKQSKKISLEDVIDLFNNVLGYHKQVEYETETRKWFWCISNNGSDSICLFGVLNKIRPEYNETIFDWNKYEEKETEIKNKVEEKVKFVIIPSSKLIVSEFKDGISSSMFRQIFEDIWGLVNKNICIIKLTEKTEKWTYARVVGEFDVVNEIMFKNIPYPNPEVSFRYAKELFDQAGFENLKSLGGKGEKINLEFKLLESLMKVQEIKNKGEYEGMGKINNKIRYFHNGIYKLFDRITFEKENMKDFVNKVIDSVKRLIR